MRDDDGRDGDPRRRRSWGRCRGRCDQSGPTQGSVGRQSELPAPDAEIASKWLSYPAPPRADVLLPAGYDPHKRYPLVVFLNGLDFNYNSYVEYGLDKPFVDLGAIVVMPEGGNGWYTDWWNNGQRGNPSWESYELRDRDPDHPGPLSDPPAASISRPHRHIDGRTRRHVPRWASARLLRVRGHAFRDSWIPSTRRQPCSRPWRSSRCRRRTATTTPIRSTVPRRASTPSGHNPTLLVRNLAVHAGVREHRYGRPEQVGPRSRPGSRSRRSATSSTP